ncbi:hypothetical protein FB567DRAFT_519211 [Paraphoma chrysanthemicola]|uniref:Secreted protein n=1 Tax=Paraphoma chrysanthemicola TaxID=798071 RepID=A0A8K0W2D3_9PLEO|nr:hypothetical protein FB567DRAFT_519211 [Paraphoma chrysanthemicola]
MLCRILRCKLSWFGLGLWLRECECEAPFKCAFQHQDCNIANPVSKHQDFKPSPVLTVAAHRNSPQCPFFLPSILYLSTGILGPATPQRHFAAGANVAHPLAVRPSERSTAKPPIDSDNLGPVFCASGQLYHGRRVSGVLVLGSRARADLL